MVDVNEAHLVSTMDWVGMLAFHLSDSSRNPPFNSVSPVTNENQIIYFEFSELNPSLVMVLLLFHLLFFYSFGEVGLLVM